MPVLQHFQENLLYHVFTQLNISRLPEKVVVELLVILLKQVSQLIQIAVSNGRHQLMVGGLTQLRNAPFRLSLLI
jgi:hypothetical protein